MRTFRLAKVIAQAELLRLRSMARRLAFSAAFGLIALFFLICALVVLHVVIAIALTPSQGPLLAVVYVLIGDVVITVLFALLAVFNRPGKVEREALELRQQARLQLDASLTKASLVASATRSLGLRPILAAIAALWRTTRRRKARA